MIWMNGNALVRECRFWRCSGAGHADEMRCCYGGTLALLSGERAGRREWERTKMRMLERAGKLKRS